MSNLKARRAAAKGRKKLARKKKADSSGSGLCSDVPFERNPFPGHRGPGGPR